MSGDTLSIDDLVLECLPRTTYTSEKTFWEKYQRLCDRQGVLALPGQCKTALRRLHAAGKIAVKDGKVKKVA
jgi:hypothetical protein